MSEVPPTRPYRDDPVRYEQACLREVFKGLYDFPLEETPTVFHAIFLEGSYPDTKLTIVLSRLRPLGRLEWDLWGDDLGQVKDDESNRASPEQFAGDVSLQVYEYDAS